MQRPICECGPRQLALQIPYMLSSATEAARSSSPAPAPCHPAHRSEVTVHLTTMHDSPHANARRRAMRGHLIAKGLAWLGGAAFILLLLSASGVLGLLSAGAAGGGRGGTPLAGPTWQAIHEEYARDLRVQDAGEVRSRGAEYLRYQGRSPWFADAGGVPGMHTNCRHGTQRHNVPVRSRACKWCCTATTLWSPGGAQLAESRPRRAMVSRMYGSGTLAACGAPGRTGSPVRLV